VTPLFTRDGGGIEVGGFAAFGQFDERARHAQRGHHMLLRRPDDFVERRLDATSPQPDQDALRAVEHPCAAGVSPWSGG
jgi:hypothetical protein